MIKEALEKFVQFFNGQAKCPYGTRAEERVQKEAERYKAVYFEWDRFRRSCIR